MFGEKEKPNISGQNVSVVYGDNKGHIDQSVSKHKLADSHIVKKKKWWNHWAIKAILIAILSFLGWLAQQNILKSQTGDNKPIREQQQEIKSNSKK